MSKGLEYQTNHSGFCFCDNIVTGVKTYHNGMTLEKDGTDEIRCGERDGQATGFVATSEITKDFLKRFSYITNRDELLKS
nr:hypothetical protein [Lysinibacillus timonensis]